MTSKPDLIAEAITVEQAAKVLLEAGVLDDITGWTGQPHVSSMDFGPNVAAKMKNRLRTLAQKDSA